MAFYFLLERVIMFSLWPFHWYVKVDEKGHQNRTERKPEAGWSLSENTERHWGVLNWNGDGSLKTRVCVNVPERDKPSVSVPMLDSCV